MSERLDRAVQSISLKTGCFHQPAFGFPQRAAESLAGKHVPAKPSPSAATRVTSHLCIIFHPVIPLSLPSRAKINKLTNKQSLGKAVADGEASSASRLSSLLLPKQKKTPLFSWSTSRPSSRCRPGSSAFAGISRVFCAFAEMRVKGAASVKTAT